MDAGVLYGLLTAALTQGILISHQGISMARYNRKTGKTLASSSAASRISDMQKSYHANATAPRIVVDGGVKKVLINGKLFSIKDAKEKNVHVRQTHPATGAHWSSFSKVAPKEGRTGHDGVVYDSRGEMLYYYNVLLPRYERGEIGKIERQARHPLILPDGTKVVGRDGRQLFYKVDFQYPITASGAIEYVEYKGYMQRDASLRIALFNAIKKVKVVVVGNAAKKKVKK
jgi:hypothetical protein